MKSCKMHVDPEVLGRGHAAKVVGDMRHLKKVTKVGGG